MTLKDYNINIFVSLNKLFYQMFKASREFQCFFEMIKNILTRCVGDKPNFVLSNMIED